jgi:hypothetical protein
VEKFCRGDNAKRTKEYDMYKKFLQEKNLETVNECAGEILARVEQQAKVEKRKAIKHPTSKVSNTKTWVGKRKSPRREISMTEDRPCWTHIRSELKETSMKQAEKRIDYKKRREPW